MKLRGWSLFCPTKHYSYYDDAFSWFCFEFIKERRATVHESKVGEGYHEHDKVRKKARLKTELMGKTPQFEAFSIKIQIMQKNKQKGFFFPPFFFFSPSLLLIESLITELKSWALFVKLKYDKLQKRKKKPVPPFLCPTLHPQFTQQQGAQTQPEAKTMKT